MERNDDKHDQSEDSARNCYLTFHDASIAATLSLLGQLSLPQARESRLSGDLFRISYSRFWAESGGFCRGVNRRCLPRRYNRGYTIAMKTAISIPDAIFEEAERLAKIRGWSRSELYSNAVSAYVNSERFLGVREKLDAVYGQNVDDSAVDPLLANAQARSLPKEKW